MLRYNVVSVIAGLAAKETRSSLAKVRISYNLILISNNKRDLFFLNLLSDILRFHLWISSILVTTYLSVTVKQNIYNGEQGWYSGESTCLPPLLPGFDS